ncbi:hypothetical protein NDI45_27275 [Leptolyngbya sp. GB1-A1]|uniref:hypothetical protein n=1 Tax=Leptolyngbya sp. GB1-A1 TaxID=2933908 RepID=UPI0032986223
MSTAKTKKLIRRRQKGPLQRSSVRRSVTSGRAANRTRSATDSALSGSALSPSLGSGGSQRASTPGALTRSQSTRSLTPGRPEARRARADARADTNPYSPLQVSKPAALKRQNAKRDLNPTQGKQVSPKGKPKRDFATGRTLFPVEGDGGKIQYLPVSSEATSLEVQNGAFIPDAAVQKAPVNTLADLTTVKSASLRDFATGRTVFATETADGKREYLPKRSEATALELSQGKYVPDEQVEVPPKGNKVLNKPPLRDFATGRTVFATAAVDGSTEYLPKKSEATALELNQGRYLNDEDVTAKAPLGAENAMSDRPPKYDLGKGRKVYPVNTPEGKTIYLPRKGEADGLELAKGLFIPDDVVANHESQRRRTALRDDAADGLQRRAQRAAKLPAGVNRRNDREPPIPVRQAEDGTPLWDGFTPPEVSEEKQHETLKTLKPKYDIGKERMLYPTETAQGKVEYLPLHRDASSEEKFLKRHAAFVPPELLENFLTNAEAQGEITRQSFVTKQGDVRAYSQEDINNVFEQAPTLVLRSAQLVSDSARQTHELQQRFTGTEVVSNKNSELTTK